MLGPMDERMDDWHLEEFPFAFAMIGPVSLVPLAEYLSQPDRGEYARICTAHGLREVVRRHPEVRQKVVDVLAGQLEQFANHPESLNSFLVSYLMDLKATEAAVVIERAFAADRVDSWIVGNWDKVRTQLGVEGLGLVPEQLATPHDEQRPAPPGPWQSDLVFIVVLASLFGASRDALNKYYQRAVLLRVQSSICPQNLPTCRV